MLATGESGSDAERLLSRAKELEEAAQDLERRSRYVSEVEDSLVDRLNEICEREALIEQIEVDSGDAVIDAFSDNGVRRCLLESKSAPSYGRPMIVVPNAIHSGMVMRLSAEVPSTTLNATSGEPSK